MRCMKVQRIFSAIRKSLGADDRSDKKNLIFSSQNFQCLDV